MFREGMVVQFGENHKWCKCFGTIEEVKKLENDFKYLVSVPIIQDNTVCFAYIFVLESECALNYVGWPTV